MANTEKNPFWQFSLQLYSQAGVLEACLSLQDRFGRPVNWVLWSLWLASQQQRLTEQVLVRAGKELHPWQQQVLQPAREVRRQIKRLAGSTSDSYLQAKAFELTLERYEQNHLWHLSELLEADTRLNLSCLATDNLQCYSRHMRNLQPCYDQSLQDELDLYDFLVQFLG